MYPLMVIFVPECIYNKRSVKCGHFLYPNSYLSVENLIQVGDQDNNIKFRKNNLGRHREHKMTVWRCFPMLFKGFQGIPLKNILQI